MSLPKAFLDELRARVPLSDVIGKRMKLTRAGREFKGCCPFHKEKTPSFTVNDIKGFYHCFGCGVHGDSIAFLMGHDNMAFMDAVEQLAGLAGMQVPKPTVEEAQKYQMQAGLYDLMELAAKWYEHQLHLPENKKILRYLMERGLSLETIRSFRLGFAPTEDHGLKGALLKKNFKTDSLLEVGLFRKSTKNAGELYPFFRGRVMFPVQDFQGRVVAFGGRVLPESYGGPPGKDAPKYINSPESPIFHKGRMLYGLSRARRAIGDGEPVVVVEGYMDVIALAQAGFKAAVAPLGTALTETQIQELWKTMPEDNRAPILCFDGDAAGQRAAGRALDNILPILKPDHSARFAFLPEEHDPDSLIKAEGVPAMDKVLKNAVGLFDMMWMEEARGRNFSQPETKAGFRAGLERRARAIADMSVQEFFIHEIGQKVSEFFLTEKTQKKREPFIKGKRPQPGTEAYRPLQTKVKAPRSTKHVREKILIAAMINYPQLFEEFAEQFGMIFIEHDEYDRLRQALMQMLDAEPDMSSGELRQRLVELGHGSALEDVFSPSLYVHAGFAKPGQTDVDAVRQGWQDTCERCLRRTG